MIFAFATLAFAVTTWLAIVALATTCEDYGPRILAALSGNPPSTLPAMTVRMRPRYPSAAAVRLPARPRLRAAA
jgi:hypothetical protein